MTGWAIHRDIRICARMMQRLHSACPSLPQAIMCADVAQTYSFCQVSTSSDTSSKQQESIHSSGQTESNRGDQRSLSLPSLSLRLSVPLFPLPHP